MPIFKEVWTFNSPGENGGRWSELYYASSPDLSTASDFDNAFLDKRLKLLSPKANLQMIRVSQIDQPRVTQPVKINKAGTWTGAAPLAPLDVALVAELRSSVQPSRRFVWLSGIPADSHEFDANNNPNMNVIWTGLLDQWIATLKNNSYIVLKRRPATDVLTPKVPLKSVDGTVPGFALLKLQNAMPGVAVGNLVSIHRTDNKLVPGLRGQTTVLAVGAPDLTVAYVTPNNAVIPTPGAYVRLVKYFDSAIIDDTVSGFSFVGGRQRQDPFTRSRGAKRPDRRLRLSQ